MTTYGSVCSGIESASCAWHPLGFRAEWFAEIEPFPSAVLAHRWPAVPNLGDMTKLARQVLAGTIAAPEVLVGGTPCQAFSVVGMRAGLDDPRGQLTIKYVELADAVDHVRPAGDECIVVWENVPGVLSDKGNAFGCFLGALVGESDALQPTGGKWTDAGCVYGPRRAAAWRGLDAQYFGLAQRRRRVFVVASARAGFDPAAVLFEREGVRRDTAPRRGEGQEAACTLDARTEGGGFPGTDGATGGHVVAPSAWPKVFGGNNTSGPIDVAPARNACASASGRMDFESEAFIVHATQDPCVSSDTAFALGRNSGQENAVFAIQNATRGKDQNGLGIASDAPRYTLDQASQHAVFAIQAGALRTNPASGPDGVGVQEGHAYTLEARAEVQAVCVTGDITHTLKADGFDGSEDGTGRGQPIVTCDVVGTMSACGATAKKHGFGWGQQDWESGYCQPHSSAVRRLTPTECERLQGFPDNYTLIPWRGKPADECPDGPRYKAIGNSKAVPVVRWIGRRIKRQLEMQN